MHRCCMLPKLRLVNTTFNSIASDSILSLVQSGAQRSASVISSFREPVVFFMPSAHDV